MGFEEGYVTEVHIVNADRLEYMVGAKVHVRDNNGNEKLCGVISAPREGYWMYCNAVGSLLQITQLDECLYAKEITVYGMQFEIILLQSSL